MNFTDFKNTAVRGDAEKNNAIHYFSSRIQIYLSFFLYKLSLSPNTVTFLFGLVGVFSGLSIIYEYLILGYILWRLHIIIDMADGSIARAKKQFSSYADGYDKTIHIIVCTLIIFVVNEDTENFYSIYFILSSFLIYYLFNKIFQQSEKGVSNYSMTKNIIKDAISLEGYIFLSLFLDIIPQYQLNFIYAIFFLLIYSLKVFNMVYKSK